MKILITGGTGFLGSHTARRLKAQGREITALGRNQAACETLAAEGIHFVRADLADAQATEDACRDKDAVIHSGALASPWGKYEVFFNANVLGTRNIVRGAIKHGVKRIVNISTPSVYFDYRHRLGIKETDPLPPKQMTHYAATKLQADEELAAARLAGIETISLRPRAIFGPGDQTVLGRTLRTAMKGPVPLIGEGQSFVDMTYVDNVVDAIELALHAPRTLSGRVFNITNGEPKSTNDILTLLAEKLDLNIRTLPLPFFAAYALAAMTESYYSLFKSKEEPPLTRYAVGLMSRSQTLDISAARNDLKYTPKVPLAEGFEKFGEWWKNSAQAIKLRTT